MAKRNKKYFSGIVNRAAIYKVVPLRRLFALEKSREAGKITKYRTMTFFGS